MENKQWRWLKLKSGDQVKVDKEDHERLNRLVWKLRTFNSRAAEPQVIHRCWDQQNKKRISLYLAREVMQEKGDKVVIRKDATVLDFRKANLLVCSRKEKERLRGKTKRETTSIYKGVCWDQRSGSWRVTIFAGKRQKHLGFFPEEEEAEAAKAYNAAAEKYYGEFAYVNKIEIKQ